MYLRKHVLTWTSFFTSSCLIMSGCTTPMISNQTNHTPPLEKSLATPEVIPEVRPVAHKKTKTRKSVVTHVALKTASRMPASTVFSITQTTPSGVVSTTTSALLGAQTTESAICKYSATTQVFTSMTGAFTTTGALVHNTSVSGLLPNKTYSYYIACQSKASTAISPTVKVTFTTAPVLDVTGYLPLSTEAFLPNIANNYDSTKSCAIYEFYDSSPGFNMYVAEDFTKLATSSPAACKAFIQKYYLSHENCGASVDSSFSIIGVLKNTADGPLKFNYSNGMQNISLAGGTSTIVMGASKCASTAEYNQNKGSLWSKVPKCDYATNKLCVNPNTPILSQSAPKLATYVAQATGNSAITRDMGWCGAVALTMSELGSIYSSTGEFNQDSFLWKSNLPTSAQGLAIKDVNERTAFYANTIYKMGNLAHTDWAHGGTATIYSQSLMEGHFDPAVGNLNRKTYDGELLRRQYKILTDKWDFNSLIDLISVGQNMSHAVGSSVIRDCTPQTITKVKTDGNYSYWEASNFTCVWKRSSSSHSLSVNGIEDGYVKMYDPWGKVYNLKVIANTTIPSLNLKVALGVPVGVGANTGYFQDGGALDATLPSDYVIKAVTSETTTPIIRKVTSFYYISVFGYHTAVVGKKK